jgi:hypothetical protein
MEGINHTEKGEVEQWRATMPLNPTWLDEPHAHLL